MDHLSNTMLDIFSQFNTQFNTAVKIFDAYGSNKYDAYLNHLREDLFTNDNTGALDDSVIGQFYNPVEMESLDDEIEEKQMEYNQIYGANQEAIKQILLHGQQMRYLSEDSAVLRESLEKALNHFRSAQDVYQLKEENIEKLNTDFEEANTRY